MARPREPIDLLQAKGKKHLTKEEIAERKSSEVESYTDHIQPPAYLSAKQKREFQEIAQELLRVEILSNLDCDTLARFIIARANYVKFTKAMNKIKEEPGYWEMMKDASLLQDRAFKQCQATARDLGLNITARCRLVIPKEKETPVENKFSRFAGGSA